VSYDPKKIYTADDLVAELAYAGCLCPSLKKVSERAQTVTPGWRPDPCIGCRARAAIRGEAAGTLDEALARREERIVAIHVLIEQWRRARRT
jgi:hypothetical protein